MSSSLIPFLIFTAMSQQNIINQQRMSMNSYRSSSRRSSSSSYRSTPRLPEKMAYILEKAENRDKGVSYFDVLMIRAIHSDEKAQQAIIHIANNHSAINAKNRADAVKRIQALAAQTQEVYNESQTNFESIKAMGFDIEFPAREYSMFYNETPYDVKGYIPSTSSKDNYTYNYFKFPKFINGLDTNNVDLSLANPYTTQFDEYVAAHPNNDNLLMQAQQEFDKLNKNKLALAFSKKKRESLEQARITRDKHQSIAKSIAQLKGRVDFYNNLSIDQKTIFRSFIRNIQVLRELSKEAEKYVKVERLIDKNASMACSTKEINAYHSAVVKQAASLLSKDEIVTLAQFEEKASNKILSLSDEQAKQIIKNSAGQESVFEIDGKEIDKSILFELSDSCLDRIDELSVAKEDKTHEEESGLTR